MGENRCCAGWCGAIGEPAHWGDIRRIGNLFKVRSVYSIVTCILDAGFVAVFIKFFSSLLPIYMQSLCQYRQTFAKSFAFKESLRLTADNPLIPCGIRKVSRLRHVSIEVVRAGLGFFLFRFRTANRFNRKQCCVILKHSFNCRRGHPQGRATAAI